MSSKQVDDAGPLMNFANHSYFDRDFDNEIARKYGYQLIILRKLASNWCPASSYYELYPQSTGRIPDLHCKKQACFVNK